MAINSLFVFHIYREELQKRKRGMIGSQTQPGPVIADASGHEFPDVSDFSIEQALEYQKANNLSLESFITGFANKIKFVVSKIIF